MSISFPTVRMRRLRHHPKVRDLISETTLNVNDFILPLFIRDGDEKKPIVSMPGHFQLSLSDLKEEIKEIVSLGIPGVILFGIPSNKDALGSDSYDDNGIMQRAIRTIKGISPDLLVISDICFCEYTDHGHCGAISEKTGSPDVDNDITLELLVKQAISHAQAGTDLLAPSGNIDGMIQAIRRGVDEVGFSYIPILSYAVKYCSSLYGPFREAADGAPQFFNRATYQMDPANASEALREVELDIAEGADMLMVKPAMAYLDVIYRVKQAYPGIPLAAYHVSGEFAMIKAASANGWLDERKTMLESNIAIKRAGADFIISYAAKDIARWLVD